MQDTTRKDVEQSKIAHQSTPRLTLEICQNRKRAPEDELIVKESVATKLEVACFVASRLIFIKPHFD